MPARIRPGRYGCSTACAPDCTPGITASEPSGPIARRIPSTKHPRADGILFTKRASPGQARASVAKRVELKGLSRYPLPGKPPVLAAVMISFAG